MWAMRFFRLPVRVRRIDIATLFNHVPDIIEMRPKEKMCGILTKPVVAPVQDVHSVRNCAMG